MSDGVKRGSVLGSTVVVAEEVDWVVDSGSLGVVGVALDIAGGLVSTVQRGNGSSTWSSTTWHAALRAA